MRRKLTAALVLCSGLTAASAAFAKNADISAPHEWRYERGKICFASHHHLGGATGRTKRAAHRAAIKEWQSFTAWEYGTVWASYRRSAGKTVEYIKAEVGWLARVESRPCRSKPRRKRRSRRR